MLWRLGVEHQSLDARMEWQRFRLPPVWCLHAVWCGVVGVNCRPSVKRPQRGGTRLSCQGLTRSRADLQGCRRRYRHLPGHQLQEGMLQALKHVRCGSGGCGDGLVRRSQS